MIDLQKLLTELFSGIAQYKPSTKEIYTKDIHGDPITVEILDAETYIVRRYYNSGKLYFQYEYQNGKLHGTNKVWYENGQIRYQHKCQNGKLHGIWKYWHKNGKLWWQHKYQNGELHGTSKEWDKNGQLWHQQEFQNGKLI